MKLVVLASYLVLGTLVASSPVREHRNFEECSKSKPKFTSILVFGDSFSDNGNGTWARTNHAWPADPAYFNGRFSDGPIWPDYLLDLLGAQKLLDFAYGGATINNSIVQGFTGPNSDFLVPSVVDQVNSFLSTSLSETEPRSTLAVLLAGINDAFFAGSGLNVRALTDSMINSVKLLSKEGFQTFIVPQTQAGALLPYYVLYNPEGIATQQQFSEDFKGNLTLSLKAANLPRYVKIYLFDEYGSLKSIMKTAEKQGFQPEQPCLNGAYGETSPRTLCHDPEKHVFFDIFHPSTVTHQAIAKAIAKELKFTH